MARYSYGAYLVWDDENGQNKYGIGIGGRDQGNRLYFIDYILNKVIDMATTEDITNAIGNAINSSY